MNNRKNFITALLLQVATILQGLIFPRLIIANFGSDVNGLVSSITQFLSFISLLEGGLGAVVLAELYKPIEQQDDQKVREILYACQRFFRGLALIFVGYTIVLSVVYPIFIAKSFSYKYTSSLVLILSVSTLAQYMFSITSKLLLQARQKIYIVNIIMTVTVLLNLLLAVVVISIFPEIHVIKLCSAVVFLIQPIFYNHFVEKRYSIRRQRIHVEKGSVLKNRWSGFAQNLAYFINMNTDIAVITIFASLADVSVYSVYMLAINALRALIVSAANSYQSALGKYYAEGDLTKLKQRFFKFEGVFWIIGIVLFSTCLVLINPFIQIYTTGIHDANYYRPVFGFLMVIANMIYCVREPYRLLVLAVGRFKETNFGSIAEAVINLSISVVLVWSYGLVGVAIGTLVAITYRLFYFVWFLKKDIIFISYTHYLKYLITLCVIIVLNCFIYIIHPLSVTSFGVFLVYGCVAIAIEALLTLSIYKLVDLFQRKILGIG